MLDENTINYSIFVNNLSAIYKKNLNAEKDSETHVLHDNNNVFKGADQIDNKIAMTISNDYVTSHLAIFNLDEDDYSQITDGDSFDEYPAFSHDKKYVVYSSKGVGRDYNGNFVKYSPSAVYLYDLTTSNITEVLSDDRYSYVKPKIDGYGNLYAIRKPAYTKEKGNNFLLNIITLPFRLIKAFYYFLESFTASYTGKSASGLDGVNPAKQTDKTPKEIFVEGNKINAEKEYKLNKKHDGDLAGVIPNSYELIKVEPNGNTTVIYKGAIAYDICGDNEVLVSNGKYVLSVSENKTKKICESNMSTCISV